MAKIKNKNSLSSFHFVLKRFNFNSFSKNSSYIFILLIFFVFISQSPFCYVSSLQIGSSGFGTLQFISRTRFSRSPFMPPTVTSFKPSVRRTSQRKTESNERINQSKVAVLPPFVLSQSVPLNKSQKPEKRITSLEPKSPSKSLFPRPPMIVQFSRHELINDDNINTVKDEELSVIPQNDQHPLAATETDQTATKNISSKEHEVEKNVSQKDSTEKRTPLYNTLVKTAKPKDLKGFHEVLEALDITVEELQLILKKKNISLDQFLEFIDSEKSKEEIIKFLNLPQSLKNSNYRNEEYSSGHKVEKSVPYSVDNSDKFIRVDRQKVLVDHLPFTEIVHDVPLRTQSYKETSFNSDKSLNGNLYLKERDDKKRYNDEVNDKKIKNKHTQQKTQEINPFLMNSQFSTMLPPRDSPIIIPFLPPIRKPTKPPPKGATSIISLTMEEKVKNYQTTKLPVRNKVISQVEEQNYKYSPKSDQRAWSKNSYDQQQANLRLVFPMKGILMFCGILGVVAVITIIILIIYGAIKCNQKPTSSTYELNEHQECSGT